MMFDGLVGRTPIYNKSLELFGYDLNLCRRHVPAGAIEEGEDGLGELLVRAFEEVNINQIIGAKPGIIKIPTALLSDDLKFTWPKEQIILNVNESYWQEHCQLSRLYKLRAQGYRFVLESQSRPDVIKNVPDFASFCSLDVQYISFDCSGYYRDMKQKGMRLLARNIGDSAQFNQVGALGFDYFQGSYFEKPKSISNLQIPANRVTALNLLAELQDPSVPIEKVEKIVRQDATLSYKLLRLLNSAYFGLPKKVDSIQRAVVFFGLKRIKNWVSVLIINSTEYKPKELLVTALVRAIACETLAQTVKQSNSEAYYIAGLFSVLDAIMDVPMDKILARLNLIPEIDAALLEKTGPIGEILESVCAMEHGTFPTRLPVYLGTDAILKAYLEAIGSAEQIGQHLTN